MSGDRKTGRRLWTDAEDAELAAMWLAGVPMDAMIEATGRHKAVLDKRLSILRKRGAISGEKPGVDRRPKLAVRRETATRRACLSCAKDFPSTGPGNRVCDGCKATAVYRTGGDMSVVG